MGWPGSTSAKVLGGGASVKRNPVLLDGVTGLDRQFVLAGKRTSVVSADWPTSNGSSSKSFPFVKVHLTYPEAISRSQVATRRCDVSASRRRRCKGPWSRSRCESARAYGRPRPTDKKRWRM